MAWWNLILKIFAPTFFVLLLAGCGEKAGPLKEAAPPIANAETPTPTANFADPAAAKAIADAYAQKYALWRKRCPTDLENAELPAAELTEIFAIIEDHAYAGEVDAMLCLARRPALDNRSIWEENAYFWFTLAALADPDMAALITQERDPLATLLQPASIWEAQMDAQREFKTIQNSEK